MKAKNIFCRLFGHKWNYFQVHKNVGDNNGQDVRVCKRCGLPEAWTRHITGEYIWSIAIWYTEKGARQHVQGYGVE